MNENFLNYWNRAKRYEEDGHNFFKATQFLNAAESHKYAAELFEKALELLDEGEAEVRIRTVGNHHIEMANYYQSLATDHFYKGEKQKALKIYRKAIEEQKKVITEYSKEKKHFTRDLKFLNVTLHFLLAYENICSAQMAFLSENYQEAVEFFKTAEIHSNLESEFLSELGDLERLDRSKARSFYVKGQIFRSEALKAMQNKDVGAAKEKYLAASHAFKNASKLYPDWGEYRELAEKTKKMGLALKA